LVNGKLRGQKKEEAEMMFPRKKWSWRGGEEGLERRR